MNQKMLQKSRRSNRSGFTLIELTMVVFILAIVAGLAVPILGWLRRSANYASQANTQAALVSNFEFFRTTYGNNSYPNYMDSLVMDGTTDAIYAAGGIGHDSGHDTDLYEIGDLTEDQGDCLTKSITHVYDHTTQSAGSWLQGSPSNSGETVRALADPVVTVAKVTVATGEGALLASEIYPAGVPSDVQLVVFGIGPGNTAVGKTMASAPTDSRVDSSAVYGRYLAVYATYEPREGRRAQLKAILNAKGRTANNALSEFWSSTNPE
jgi:prepilin-type N-terminal cleavage/methylation domain-containing protein